jgi:hypothetical protein
MCGWTRLVICLRDGAVEIALSAVNCRSAHITDCTTNIGQPALLELCVTRLSLADSKHALQYSYITLHYMLHSKEEWEPRSGANERLIGGSEYTLCTFCWQPQIPSRSSWSGCAESVLIGSSVWHLLQVHTGYNAVSDVASCFICAACRAYVACVGCALVSVVSCISTIVAKRLMLSKLSAVTTQYVCVVRLISAPCT